VPKVSIIIPAYNAESTIFDTITSVLNQTFLDFELIIVNDGSTDDTESIIISFSDERIKYFKQKNKGQCAANNFGLSQAKGDYIKFFDADDIMNEKHIEAQYEKIKNNKTTLASCKWGRFYNDDIKNAKFVPELVWKDLKTYEWLKTALSQRHDMMGGCLWLIPKIILDKVGGWDESLTLNNDFEFSIRLLLAAEKVFFADEALLFYRTGVRNTLSQSTSEADYIAAYKSNLMGCNYLLAKDNSKTMKTLCANRFQEWVYTIYPDHNEIVEKFEHQIKVWGGSSIEIEGGKILILLSKLFGWKIAKRIKLFLNKYLRF
jgi:glycosyltransferase involved in cell wall biosynthesis